MEEFLSFFEEMATWQRLLWVFICLSASWILEGNFPLVRHTYNKRKHDGVNLIFLAGVFAINLLFGIATVEIFVWIESKEIGLLHLVQWPLWVELLIAVMVLDFLAQYVAHYLLHRIKWMWKLHMVHHSDTKVDATTGTRLHPGDYFVREVFALGAIMILGLPIAVYLFYRMCTIFFTYFSHSNVSMPRGFDKALSYVFVTPNMHKFHHHFERPWTDSNFGSIFSIWDRMLGTFVYDDPSKIKYGLDVLDGNLDEDFGYQIRIPINKDIKTDY